MNLFQPKLPNPEKPYLLSTLSKIQDTFLVNLDLTKLVERVKNAQGEPIYQKLASSGLVEVAMFLTAIGCP